MNFMTLTPAVREALGRAAEGTTAFGRLDYGTKFLVALNATGHTLYAGTVPAAEKARRRAANKVARRSRRINRLRGA